jgi:hypothetical protein
VTPGDRAESNAVSEIGEHWMEKCFHFFLVFKESEVIRIEEEVRKGIGVDFRKLIFVWCSQERHCWSLSTGFTVRLCVTIESCTCNSDLY